MSSPELVTLSIQGEHVAKALVKGEGSPVLFLHGAGGLHWDGYLEEIAKQRKVIAPYFPGTAETAGANELDLRGVWDLVLYYYDLLDQLGVRRADVIGHSFGGMLAAELAATDNNRFDHLVLIGAAGLWNPDIDTPDLGTIIADPNDLHARMFVDTSSPVAQQAIALPEDEEERLRAIVEQVIMMAEASKYLWPIPDKGLRRRLHRIRAKTLIMWGEKDGLIPVQYAYEFQKGIQGSRVVVFENAAHFPQLERLSDAVNATLELLNS
ncbi:MAG: alpha/beta hydrolase [Alicyclobacillaceae bacterium]|nr:alpha/beta hydrolase [Alicyclobacillaceae bacterium]